MSDGSDTQPTSFPWPETLRQLAGFAHQEAAAVASGDGLRFVGARLQLQLPRNVPLARAGESPRDYLLRIPELPQRHLVILLRAGAMAIGYWQGEELLLHKAQKRYVVRGNGKGQPLHLKTRGKSRYGSRLRLQNWQRLLTDLTSRLVDWCEQIGEPERIHYGCAVRVWSELFAAAEPPPPFAAEDHRLLPIPLHTHEPDHRELLSVWRQLGRGRVHARPADADLRSGDTKQGTKPNADPDTGPDPRV